MTLADFLLARIAEDEGTAQAALEYLDMVAPDRHDYGIAVAHPGVSHEMRWTPEHVLAECEAKRQIVEAYTIEDFHYGNSPWDGCGDDCEWKALEWALKLLALPYASHPDYREEWRA
jgi:hypothetical protein